MVIVSGDTVVSVRLLEQRLGRVITDQDLETITLAMARKGER